MAGRRTSFYFPREAVAALEAIRRRTRFENGADVIRLAVLTYSKILEYVDSGSKVFVVDQNDEQFAYSPYRPFDYPGMPDFEASPAAEGFSSKNFFFSGDIVDKLDQIRARGFVRTNSDAIRVALTAYRELSGVAAVGDEIVIRRRDETAFSFDPDAPYGPQVPNRGSQIRAELATTAPI
jgi:Arc/MetJ-type ribon-helix-helix transcriptional regulator